MPETILVNNTQVPRFLYGTAWKEERTKSCVTNALSTGFRGIDTANQRKHYHEVGVGEAIQEAYSSGGIHRADLFIQTKFTHRGGQDHRLPYDPNAPLSTQVVQSYRSSLEHLNTDYLDSYILHGPSQRYGLAPEDWEAWRAMEKLSTEGKVKLLGVSNVTLDQLKLVYQEAEVKPVFVQNRCYARTKWDQEVRKFCRDNGMYYQGFSLLTGNPEIFGNTLFRELMGRYQCTEAQLIFSFSLHVQMIVLTGTTDPNHMREDLLATSIRMEEQDVLTIESIAKRN